ncbi:glycosyltransferase family 39 protein [Oscillatoria salina]|uniref:glycosyltransferase family 39 protein n=1 Tax=Oscillatoria salina TaxID=331517 RepID=UPI001CCC0AB8|nr:glycosyltransferase [Oscillatoria salina]MBZ8182264.1 glycosyltransferase [Oscillatoria salina IIICB1]
MKPLNQNRWLHIFLLLLWIFLGTILRFANLTGKSPWTDEFATMVFSLGNSYQEVPLNQVISLETLLKPLQPNPNANIGDVISLLRFRDNHPPVYFILVHWWQQLFPTNQGYLSLWAARSLPALFGVISIPATFGLAKLAFRSLVVAQLAAAMMAVSPYGIFLAQEARHYSLATVFVIFSLTCLVVAARRIWLGQKIPFWLVFLWIAINSLGITIHYFFTLTLLAEAIALFVLLLSQMRTSQAENYYAGILKNCYRLSIAAIGTIITGLIWLGKFIPQDYGSEMTDWIKNDSSNIWAIINPPFQALAAWITMLTLLPVEASSLTIVIISGAAMLCFLIWAIPILYHGIKQQWQQRDFRLPIIILAGFACGAIAIFFAITYFLGIDITRGARYNFVYFPAVIVLLGASLAVYWQKFQLSDTSNNWLLNKLANQSWTIDPGKIAIVIIWLMGLFGGITVSANLGYQKYYRPDLFLPILAESSQVPALITTSQQTLVQTGEMMGIAWELKEYSFAEKVNFLLANQNYKGDRKAAQTLKKTLKQLPRPLDLWLINFHAPVEFNSCVIDLRDFPSIDGYNYQLYHCPEIDNMQTKIRDN